MADSFNESQIKDEEKVKRASKDSEKSPKDSLSVMPLLASLSGWIAGPVIFASLLGLYLDKKFGTKPIIILIAVGFAFIISVVGLFKESNKMFRSIAEAEERKKVKKEGFGEKGEKEA